VFGEALEWTVAEEALEEDRVQTRLLVLLGLQQQIEGHDRDTARRAIDWLPTDSIQRKELEA
jgi:hypothetical protein